MREELEELMMEPSWHEILVAMAYFMVAIAYFILGIYFVWEAIAKVFS